LSRLASTLSLEELVIIEVTVFLLTAQTLAINRLRRTFRIHCGESTQAAFAKNAASMRELGGVQGWDRVAFAAAFQITMLEGTEVVFIVIAIGAGRVGLLPRDYFVLGKEEAG